MFKQEAQKILQRYADFILGEDNLTDEEALTALEELHKAEVVKHLEDFLEEFNLDTEDIDEVNDRIQQLKGRDNAA